MNNYPIPNYTTVKKNKIFKNNIKCSFIDY